MIEISLDAFEELVANAVENLPEPFASHLSNVDIVVEDEPDPQMLSELGSHTLYGLYQGIPQTSRNANYTFVMPDKITIFRGPISRACDTADEIREEVSVTVVHEIAHHFGISDERLDELGW